MIAVITVVASFILLPDDLVKYSKSAIAALAFLSNFYFYSDVGYFNESADLKPLLHTWSLGVEEQFYLLVPLVLAAFYRFLPRWFWLCLIGLLVGISFGLGIWLGGHAAGFYLPFTRAWELGIGMLLAFFAYRITISRIFVADIIGLGSVVLIFGAYFMVSDMTAWPGVAALAPVLGATGLIVAGTHPNALVARLLSKAPMVFFGKISYSLYLWHWPLIVLAGYGAFRPFNIFESLMLIVSATLVATISWKWIEQPIRQRRFLRSQITIFGSTFASALLLVGGLFLVWKTDGLPNRIDPEIFDRWQAPEVMAAFKVDECHGLNAARVQQNDICLLGAGGGAATFALVGDSHARALAPAIFQVAADFDVAGYQLTGPGFVPTPDRMRVGAISGTARPDARVDALRAFLHQNTHIKTAIVTGWWHRYATGASYRDQDAAWYDEECGAEAIRSCNAKSLARSLNKLVQEFPRVHFVFLDDVPVGWDLHPKSYFRAEFTGRDIGGAQLPRAVAQQQFVAYSGILSDIAANHTNATFSPILLDSLCDIDGCSVVDQHGSLLFSDGDHLSTYGALQLMDEIQAVFQEHVLRH